MYQCFCDTFVSLGLGPTEVILGGSEACKLYLQKNNLISQRQRTTNETGDIDGIASFSGFAKLVALSEAGFGTITWSADPRESRFACDLYGKEVEIFCGFWRFGHGDHKFFIEFTDLNRESNILCPHGYKAISLRHGALYKECLQKKPERRGKDKMDLWSIKHERYVYDLSSILPPALAAAA